MTASELLCGRVGCECGRDHACPIRFLKIVGILRDEPYLAHGTDVFYSTAITAKMRERWEEVKQILAEAPGYDEITDLIGRVRLNIGELYEVYVKDKIRDAMLWAKELKDRYTALWAYTDLFGYSL